MSVRPAQEKDCDAMAAIHRTCLPQDWRAEALHAWLEHPTYRIWVAEKDGAIAGYLVAQVMPPEAEVVTIAIDEPYRRQGLAQQLMQVLIQTKGVHVCRLDVSDTNQAAQQLYARLGFVKTGLRPDYYADGDAAVVMQWGDDAAVQEKRCKS